MSGSFLGNICLPTVRETRGGSLRPRSFSGIRPAHRPPNRLAGKSTWATPSFSDPVFARNVYSKATRNSANRALLAESILVLDHIMDSRAFDNLTRSFTRSAISPVETHIASALPRQQYFSMWRACVRRKRSLFSSQNSLRSEDVCKRTNEFAGTHSSRLIARIPGWPDCSICDTASESTFEIFLSE